MGIEFRKRCLEHAVDQCRQDAIVNMTDDEIYAEWGLQRSPAGPLHAAADAITTLRAENERMREALKSVEAWLTSWGSHVAYCRGYPNCTCGLDAMRNEARVALSDPRALEEQKP